MNRKEFLEIIAMKGFCETIVPQDCCGCPCLVDVGGWDYCEIYLKTKCDIYDLEEWKAVAKTLLREYKVERILDED